MTAEEKLQELEKLHNRLLIKVIKLRIQLETLAKDINSDASKRILAKYRKEIIIRKEQELEGQN